MALQFCSATRVSPYCDQAVHGMMTPASLHPAAEAALDVTVPGAKMPNMSVPDCVPRRSAVNFCEKVARSILYEAVRQKTWASALQPRRSSRCGQSVGTLMKFERWPHRILLQS